MTLPFALEPLLKVLVGSARHDKRLKRQRLIKLLSEVERRGMAGPRGSRPEPPLG